MNLTILAASPARLRRLQDVIGTTADFTVAARIATEQNLPSLANGSAPDLLLVDNPDASMLRAIQSLAAARPSMQAIAISTDQSPDFFMQAMRAGVREVIAPADEAARLSEALARMRRAGPGVPSVAKEGKVIAFISCKGGAGSTFLAANTSYALAAEQSRRVALIDLNLRFGDAALHLSDQRPPSNLADLCEQIRRLDGALLEASMLEVLSNFGVLAAPDNSAHISDIQAGHIEAILNVARTRYDFVVLDVPRYFDAPVLRALDMADEIYCVMQLNLPFLRAARNLLEIFRSLDYPLANVKIILNRYSKSGELSVADLEAALGLGTPLMIPNHYAAVASSVNLGMPLLQMQRNNPVARALSNLAKDLAAAPAANSSFARGWLSRVFGGGMT